MDEVKQHDLSLIKIKSDRYIDVTQAVQWLGFKSEELVYITNFVWEKFIHWTVGDDLFFNVRQTEHQRQDVILKDVIHRLDVSGSEESNVTPNQALYFYQHIIVRGIRKAESDLVLFKLSYAINENDERCLIVEAVNIVKPLSEISSKEMLWEFHFLNDMIENVLSVNDGLSNLDNLDLLDELLQRDDKSLHNWLTINGEPEYSFMLISARKIFTALLQYFNEHDGCYTNAKQILLNVREQLFK